MMRGLENLTPRCVRAMGELKTPEALSLNDEKVGWFLMGLGQVWDKRDFCINNLDHLYLAKSQVLSMLLFPLVSQSLKEV